MLGLLFVLCTAPTFAVHDLGLFELDGNAEDDVPAAVAGDDWDTPPNAGGAFEFTGITADPAPESIFTGGRKDIQDIPQWGHKDGSVPDKDDLTNAYAAAYNNGGDLIVYFGADRFANVGDAFVGFWFFKEAVVALPNGDFSGNHTTDDTLVLVDYPQGANESPIIKVIQWDPTCSKAANNDPQQGQCAAKNLRLILSSDNAECGATAADDACAITNSANANAPWAYVPKAGVAGTFPPESFYEGGINLSAIVGDTCFSSFMAESRSSASFTASLKDFVLDDFQLCGIEVTKVCTTCTLDTTQGDGVFQFAVQGNVINAGFGTLFDVVVTDDCGTPTRTNDDETTSIGNVGAGATVPWGPLTCEPTDASGGTIQIASNTASVIAAATSGGTQDITDTSPTASCPQCNADPFLSVTKECRTCLAIDANGGSNNAVIVEIVAEGQVCNNSDDNTICTAAGEPRSCCTGDGTGNCQGINLENVLVIDDAGTPSNPADDDVVDIGDLDIGDCESYRTRNRPGDINRLPADSDCTGSGFPFACCTAFGEGTCDENKAEPILADFGDTVKATADTVLGFPSPPDATAPADCKLCPDADPRTDPGISCQDPAP